MAKKKRPVVRPKQEPVKRSSGDKGTTTKKTTVKKTT